MGNQGREYILGVVASGRILGGVSVQLSLGKELVEGPTVAVGLLKAVDLFL